MRGTPQILKTRADYDRAREAATAGHYFGWQFDRFLASADDADQGDDYRVREVRDGAGEIVELRQERWVAVGDLPHQMRLRALRAWEGLLGRWRWEFDRVLDSIDDADEGEDYRVIEVRDEDEGDVIELRQEQRVEDSAARIYRLGFTVSEVEQAVAEMEAAING